MRDLLALTISIGVPALIVLAIWRWARGPRTRIGVKADPDRPRSFGYKSSWLAVRSDDPDEVVAAIREVDGRMRDAMPCNWEHGLRRVYGGPLSRDAFVTPALRGWVLVAGYTLPTTRRPEDAPLHLVERLGAALARPVYYFGSHRGVDYVDWVIVEEGRVTRAYAHADGATLYDVGEVTPDEKALGLLFHDALRGDEDDDALYERLPDESTVIELASRWTVNPCELGAIEEPSVGRLVRFR